MFLKIFLLKSWSISYLLFWFLRDACFLLSWQWIEQESKICAELQSKDWASWFIRPSEAAHHQRPVLRKYSSQFLCCVFSNIIKCLVCVWSYWSPYWEGTMNIFNITRAGGLFYIVKVCTLKKSIWFRHFELNAISMDLFVKIITLHTVYHVSGHLYDVCHLKSIQTV